MLVRIRKRGVQMEKADDPFALLGACHERIRSFSALALRMLHARGAAPEDVADAAGRVHLYFTVGLPLHAADEDAELTELIQSLVPPDPVSRALDAMQREHREIEAWLEVLAPTWAGLATGALDVEGVRAATLPPTEALARLFDRHLLNEESVIFEFGRENLDADALAALTGGIRARRQSSQP